MHTAPRRATATTTVHVPFLEKNPGAASVLTLRRWLPVCWQRAAPQGPEKEPHLPWGPLASHLRGHVHAHPRSPPAGGRRASLTHTHASVCVPAAPPCPEVVLQRRPHRTVLVAALLVASCPKRGNKNCDQQVTNLQEPSRLVTNGL